MPSEAQRLANKRWREKNPEHWREIRNKAKAKHLENNKEGYEKHKLCAKEYYWRNREKILEKKRQEYIQRNTQNEMRDFYDAHCQPDDPITDSEDLHSEGSIVSDITDWETVRTTVPDAPPPVATPPPPMAPVVDRCFCHPLFKN